MKTPQPRALLAKRHRSRSPHPAPSCSQCRAAARHSSLGTARSPATSTAPTEVLQGSPRSPRAQGAGSTQRSKGLRAQHTKFGGGTGWFLGPSLSSSVTARFPSAAKHTEPPTISLLIHLSKNLPFPLDLEIMRQEAVTLAITFIISDVEQATIRNCFCVCARQRGSEFGVFLSKPCSERRAIHTPLQSNLPRKGMALK